MAPARQTEVAPPPERIPSAAPQTAAPTGPVAPGDAPAEGRRPDRSKLLLVALIVVVLGAGGAAAAFMLTSHSSHKKASPPRTVTVRSSPRTVTVATATPTTTAPVVPPAAASANLLPSESRTQMTQEIRALLLQFHQDIVARDAASAWQLLSARKQHQELVKDGYGAWAKAQESLAPYLHPSGIRVRILSTDAKSGIATVDVTGMKWSAPGASCTEWSGITWVKYEDGTWKYDPGYSTTAARKRAWTSRYNQLLGTQC